MDVSRSACAWFAALVFVACAGASDVMAGQIAGSIEYDVVARPAGLPADFDAPAGASLRFLTIKAMDGSRVDAALRQPTSKSPDATTLVISVHGSGGNFTGNPNGFLSKGLVARGYAVLGINTRQHDDKVNTDNFLDVRRDIEAAVFTARALGYRALVLHGHSLGNIQVQFYAGTSWDADLRAVLLTGAFANLPWKSRHLLVQSDENFRQLSEAAFSALRDGTAASVLPVRMGWIGGQHVPVTGQHFLTYRHEAASVADGTYWIKRIPKPILMVRDEGDAVVLPFEPSMLLTAARSPGSLVPNIQFVLLPNPKGPNPTGHGFADNQQRLVETIAAWLAEQKL